MYKLIIADDVIGVHQMLKQIIDKTNLGFEVIDCFSTGDEAVEFLKHTEVDVIITDIKMPHTSGLEVAKFVYENRLRTKVIILSAYAEFNYAIEAIQYNVFQYIMKPVDFFELKDTLEKVRNVIENESMTKSEGMDIERECFMLDLISGNIGDRSLVEKRYDALNFKTDIADTYVSVYKIRFINYNDVLEKLWKYGADYFNKALCGVVSGAVKEESENDVVVLMCDSDCMIFAVVGDIFESDICKKLENYFMEFMKLGVERINSRVNLKLQDIREKVDLDIDILLKTGSSEGEGVEKKAQNTAESGSVDEMMNKIKAYVREHISEEIITRDKMADMLYFTGPYFSKLFKKSTGITFGEYVLGERMKYAMELLRTNIKISDIPSKIGYNSYRHFQRVFRNYCGYSPSEYRKKLIGEVIDTMIKNEDM